MSDQKRKVLEMLEQGKITEQDAARLLDALGESKEPGEPASSTPDTKQNAEPAPNDSPKSQPITGSAPSLTLYPEGEQDDMAEEVATKVAETLSDGLRGLGSAVRGAVSGIIKRAERVSVPAIPSPPSPSSPSAMPSEPNAGSYITTGVSEHITAEIDFISIQWVSGPVEISQGTGDCIQITEYSNRPLQENERLLLNQNENELDIQWVRVQPVNGLSGLSKRLVIELPQSMKNLEQLKVSSASGQIVLENVSAHLENVKLSAASGNITARDLQGENFGFSTASGNLWIENVHGETLKADTASGKVSSFDSGAEDLSLSTASGTLEAAGFYGYTISLTTVSGKLESVGEGETVKASTTSGSLSLKLGNMPERIKLNSVSGHVDLALPADLPESGGFTVKYSTTSGAFQSSFPLAGIQEKRSGTLTYGPGNSAVDIHTVSGIINISKL